VALEVGSWRRVQTDAVYRRREDGPKRLLPIVVAIAAEPAILHPSVLDSLTIAWHGKSSGELQFSDDLKSD
jgi:hypothetical protein